MEQSRPWEEIGSQVLRLRKLASKTQAEIASGIGVDASKISRIEDGKISLTDGEARSLLEAIGTTEALRYCEYLNLTWTQVPRPAFDHPDLGVLERAERTLQRIADFTTANTSLLAQTRMHTTTLEWAAKYLVDRRHALAFLGPIGVGKTTGLSTLSGISMEGDNDPIDRILLEYGGGGTTICEVTITRGEGFRIGIEPYNDEEVIQFVNDFCAGLLDDQRDKEAERGVAKEIDRALRNMTDLKKDRSKGADGKRTTKDQAVQLARKFTPESLRAEVFTRLRTWERTTTQLVHEPNLESDGRKWLQQNFAAVNKGLRPDVGLPRRITITVPFTLLPGATVDVSIIDTKGIDGTPLRPDLTACLENPRTIAVLCSSFNDAPGPIFEQLLKQTIDTGGSANIFPRCVGLALAHDGEARKMRDDGEFVQTEEEGYELKIEQAEAQLRRWGCDGITVRIYNANTDQADSIHSFLNEKIMSMRRDYATRITHISEEIDRLIVDHQSAMFATAQQEVFRRLTIFVEQHQALPPRANMVHERLDRALREQHQRSVWATTNRAGSWPALDAYYYLGIGAGIDAKRRADPAIAGLQELLNNMLGDHTLAPTHGFLRELQTNLTTWADEFSEAVRRVGETTFRPALKSADNLWRECAERYGYGGGYRNTVARRIATWFTDAPQSALHELVEENVVRAWQIHIVQRLDALCHPPEQADAAA